VSSKDVKPQVLPGVLKMYVRVPPERIKVLVGSKYEVIKELEARTQTKIKIDEVNCYATIEPASPNTPVINVMKAKEFINAIAVGFTPEKAWRLLDEDQILIVIDLKKVIGDSLNHLTRVKGRVIGEDGRVKKNIEEITGTYISVYEDFIAIIGDYESADVARNAIEMLIQGRQHSTVYKYLDKAVHELKSKRTSSLWYNEPR
jgi:ribosomal RNA assembly protein